MAPESGIVWGDRLIVRTPLSYLPILFFMSIGGIEMLLIIFVVLSILFVFFYLNIFLGVEGRIRYYNTIYNRYNYTEEDVRSLLATEKDRIISVLDDTIEELQRDQVIISSERGIKEKQGIMKDLKILRSRIRGWWTRY